MPFWKRFCCWNKCLMVNYKFLDYYLWRSKNYGNPTCEARLNVPPNMADLTSMKHAVSSLTSTKIEVDDFPQKYPIYSFIYPGETAAVQVTSPKKLGSCKSISLKTMRKKGITWEREIIRYLALFLRWEMTVESSAYCLGRRRPSVYDGVAFINESRDDNRLDMLEELSLQSVPVSLLAQLFVWPVYHPRLGASLGSTRQTEASVIKYLAFSRVALEKVKYLVF